MFISLLSILRAKLTVWKSLSGGVSLSVKIDLSTLSFVYGKMRVVLLRDS